MSKVLLEESSLFNIGIAIRNKLNTNTSYKPSEMASAIESISTGSTPVLTQKTITANGTYNSASDSADGYSEITVNVPNSYSENDEDKVVSNGALVSQTPHAKVTQNGTYDTTLNNEIEVEISGGGSSSGNVDIGYDFPDNSNGNIGDLYIQNEPDALASKSSAYIDTGVLCDTDLEFDISCLTRTSINSTGCIIGGRSSSGSNEIQLGTYGSSGSLRFGKSISTANAYMHQYIPMRFIFKSHELSSTTGANNTFTNTDSFSSQYSLYMFGLNNSGSSTQPNQCNIYRLKIWKSGILVRDYIPYEQNGAAGAYDIVNQQFYQPLSGYVYYLPKETNTNKWIWQKTVSGWRVLRYIAP